MPSVTSDSPIHVSSESPTLEESIAQTRPIRRGLLPARAGPSTRPIPTRLQSRQPEDASEYIPGAYASSPMGSVTPPPQGRDPRQRPIPQRRQPVVLLPTAREFRPASAQGLAIPSRHASVASSSFMEDAETINIGTSRGGATRSNAIDLTEDDDEDVELIAERRAAPRARRGGPNGPLWRDLRRE